jgi:hypothetical protein
MPNVMGVHYIEETEEFMERIGRVADVPDLEQLDPAVSVYAGGMRALCAALHIMYMGVWQT